MAIHFLDFVACLPAAFIFAYRGQHVWALLLLGLLAVSII